MAIQREWTLTNLERRTHWWNFTSSSSTLLLLPLPVDSKSTLSLRPSRSSGIPERYTLILMLPTISLRNTLPLELAWRVCEMNTHSTEYSVQYSISIPISLGEEVELQTPGLYLNSIIQNVLTSQLLSEHVINYGKNNYA